MSKEINTQRQSSESFEQCLPQTCCCGCSLKTGVTILSVLTIVVSGYALAITNWTAIPGSAVPDILLNVFTLIFSIIGLFGAANDNKVMAKLYAKWCIIGVFLFVVSYIALAAAYSSFVDSQCAIQELTASECNIVKSAGTTSLIVIGIISGIIKIYLALVTWAFYRSL